MVGYAYSLDSSLGYGYILIKVYDKDAFSFVDDSSDYCLYRYSRTCSSLKKIYISKGAQQISLSLKNADAVCRMLVGAEFNMGYPVRTSWEMTPSGICMMRSCEALCIELPIDTSLVVDKHLYINITKLCFEKSPDFMRASLLCEVLCELCYRMGIYKGNEFILCGNNIYCMAELISLIEKYFGVLHLSKQEKRYASFNLYSKRYFVSHLKAYLEPKEFEYKSHLTVLTEAKQRLLYNAAKTVYEALIKHRSLHWIKRRMNFYMYEAVYAIEDLGMEFMVRASLGYSSDMKYLKFDELMDAFSSNEKMLKAKTLVAKNQKLIREYKKLKPKKYLYKGKFCAELDGGLEIKQ